MIDKRGKKLLRRMIATPMNKSHFLISLIIVRTTMNLAEAVLLFFFSYLVFGVTIQGNIGALFLIFFASNIAFAGLAVLISSRTASTEAGNGIINAVVTPMIVLSGIFFSYHNFPDFLIPVIKVLPLTLLADGIRSIFIEGAGYNEIALPFFILTVMGIIFFTAGIKLFKWH
jgi:ABC-type multidrug transport system permease subunit